MSLSTYLSSAKKTSPTSRPASRALLGPHWLEQGHMTTSEPITGDGCRAWFLRHLPLDGGLNHLSQAQGGRTLQARRKQEPAGVQITDSVCYNTLSNSYE